MRLGSRDTDDAGRAAAEAEADERAVDGTVAGDGTTTQPTFTPVARHPADGSAGRPAVRYAEVETVQTVEPSGNYRPDEDAAPAGNYTVADTEAPAAGYGTDAAGTPVTTPAAATTPPATPATTPAASPAPAGGAALDQPLLSGNTELLAQWQQVQAQFVEDPQVAVSGAADLVEQAAQALVDALEQRQRQMRGIWDRNGSAAPGESVDTEQMRQLMQRYRALFNQLYQPA